MNILYIAHIRLPTEKAHGLQIMKTCEAFARAGAEVELAVPTRANALRADPFAYYDVAPGFKITTLHVPDMVHLGLLGFIASLVLFSERAHFLPRFWKADVIYSRDALLLLQYVLLGRRLVYEAHSKPSRISVFVAKRAYRLVAITEAIAAAYVQAGISREKIVVAPDAVDLAAFAAVPARAEARSALDIKPETKIVAYVGHLYARKGADTLAEAASRIPEIDLLFIGGMDADLERFRGQWKGRDNITTIGHVPHSRALLYMRAADVLVIPNSAKDSASRAFTSPMKLFEYMASGTPIVASDVSAIREVISSECAQFCSPDDPSAFAEAIAYLFAHPEEAADKARHALLTVREHTWDARAASILARLS